MIKNATICSVRGNLPSLQIFENAFNNNAFIHTEPSQERTSGWDAPREINGAKIEAIGGQWIAKFIIETRVVPALEIKKALEKKAALIQQTTGREPGRRELRELKEEVRFELLPRAFVKELAIFVWIDPIKQAIVLDTTSRSAADAVISALVLGVDGLRLTPFQTSINPARAMTRWLETGDMPTGFELGRECELVSDSNQVVKYKNHNLDSKETASHIAQGKTAKNLALNFDNKVSFLLTENLTLKRISYLNAGDIPNDADAFDSNFLIAANSLQSLLSDLSRALNEVI